MSTIYCLGLNYLSHIDEMNHFKKPKEPVIFIKPSTAIVKSGEKVTIPKKIEWNFSKSSDLNDISDLKKTESKNEQNIYENHFYEAHHEVELIVEISKDAKNLTFKNVNEYIYGYGLGFDITLRDLQIKAKNSALPWSISKGFDTSAVISKIYPKDEINNVNSITLELRVNGERRQLGNISNMIFSVEEAIIYISHFFTLKKGDIVFMGTPEGVGKLQHGDIISGYFNGEKLLEVEVEYL
ncbi:fumarylacetoacetate hydrolase family protein [bacterium]|nr:fumarylacetoacetate hydrolase family protein [bacterium]